MCGDITTNNIKTQSDQTYLVPCNRDTDKLKLHHTTDKEHYINIYEIQVFAGTFLVLRKLGFTK